MAFAQSVSIAVTTAADGSATAYSSEVVTGLLDTIRYIKTDFDNGSTITITNEATGATLWAQTGVNASATVAPRQATHTTAGVAATYDGTRAALDRIAIAKTRIKVVIADGGNVKSGTFVVTLV